MERAYGFKDKASRKDKATNSRVHEGTALSELCIYSLALNCLKFKRAKNRAPVLRGSSFWAKDFYNCDVKLPLSITARVSVRDVHSIPLDAGSAENGFARCLPFDL